MSEKLSLDEDLARDQPIYVGHLNDLLTELKDFSLAVTSKKQQLDSAKTDSCEGISLLALKNELLSQYLVDLSEVIQRKIRGESLCDKEDDVVWRLIEGRTYLERIRPIERLLKYQIDKLVKRTTQEGEQKADPLSFKSHLVDELADDSEEADSDSDTEEGQVQQHKAEGVYIPPKVTAVYYDADPQESKERRQLEIAKKKMLSSEIVRELRSEFLDTPEEVFEASTSAEVLKKKNIDTRKERERYEEERMVRLPALSKSQRHKVSGRVSTVATIGDELLRMGGREFRAGLDGDGDFLRAMSGVSAKKKKSASGGGKKRKMKFRGKKSKKARKH